MNKDQFHDVDYNQTNYDITTKLLPAAKGPIVGIHI